MIVSEGKPRYGGMRSGTDFYADEDFAVNIDRRNHDKDDKRDDQGRVIYPALIPDARYRIDYRDEKGAIAHREFIAKSGETIDLGKFAVKSAE